MKAFYQRRLPAIRKTALFLVLSLLWLGPGSTWADDEPSSEGQTVYVPAYTHVYLSGTSRPFALAATLVVRNTDLKTPLQLTSAKYYDSQGRLAAEFISAPVQLGPLAALDLPVAKPDQGKGSGACFVVTWRSSRKISPPVIECIMIGAAGQQGISFISPGRVIKEHD